MLGGRNWHTVQISCYPQDCGDGLSLVIDREYITPALLQLKPINTFVDLMDTQLWPRREEERVARCIYLH